MHGCLAAACASLTGERGDSSLLFCPFLPVQLCCIAKLLLAAPPCACFIRACMRVRREQACGSLAGALARWVCNLVYVCQKSWTYCRFSLPQPAVAPL